MTLSEWLEPIVYNIWKPVMDAMGVNPSAQAEVAKDGSIAISSVVIGRGANYAIDYFTDGWFNNILKFGSSVLTALAGIGAYATGNKRLGQEAIFASSILADAWFEDFVKKHVKITASLQSTIEAAKKGDVSRIGLEMVNKDTLMQLSKLIGKPKTVTPTPPIETTSPPPLEVTVPQRRKVTGIR